MPRSRSDSPLADKGIRELVAPALFAEAAVHAGDCWSAHQLEERVFDSKVLVDRKQPPGELANDQFDATGLFQQMLGSRVPTHEVLDLLTSVFPGARFNELKQHSLWKLLMDSKPGEVAAVDVMNKLPASHRNFLRQAINSNSPRALYDMRRYDGLLSLDPIEALAILIGAARDQRGCGAFPARALRVIFPRLVSRAPQLFIRWRHIAMRLRKVLSGFGLCHGRWDPIDFDVYLSAGQARRDGTPLPPDTLVKMPANWAAAKINDVAMSAAVRQLLYGGSRSTFEIYVE